MWSTWYPLSCNIIRMFCVTGVTSNDSIAKKEIMMVYSEKKMNTVLCLLFLKKYSIVHCTTELEMSDRKDKIRIMLVDDHKMIIDSLQLLFKLMEGIEVVSIHYDSRQVLPSLEKETVDIVITDYHMPHLDGLQLTRILKEAYPDLKVLILSINESAEDIQNAFHAGAQGYIMKKASRSDLEEAVRTVNEGKLYFSQGAMKSILSSTGDAPITHKNLEPKIKNLTKREIEIVKLLAEELSSQEIASRLFISVGTVESHRHNILRKLNVKTTIGVIKFAIKSGISD